MCNLRYLKAICLLFVMAIGIAGCSQEGGRDTDLVQAEAYLDVADLYREQGQFRSALIETQNALQLSPGNTRARALVAHVNMDIGNLNQAVEMLSALNQQNPADTEIILQLAEAQLFINNTAAVISLLENIQGQNREEQIKRNLLLGNAFAANNSLSLAEEAFHAILAAESDHVDAMVGLSKLAFLNSDLESSFEYIDQGLSINPNHLDLWIWRGAYAVLQEQYADAEQALFQALELMSNYDTMTAKKYSVLQSILIPLQMQQKDAEALRYSQIIAQTPQGQVQNSYASAVALFEQGDYEQAQISLTNALAAAPNHPDANILMGMTRYAQGDYSAVEESLSRFVNMVSSSAQPVKTLAATQLRLGQPERALAVLRDALAKFPEDNSVVAMIGLTQQNMGRYEDSIVSFTDALAMQPNTPDAEFSLSGSYYALGEYGASIEHLENAIDINPDFNQAKTNLINLHLELGDVVSARNQTQAWLDTNPDSTFNNNLAGRVAFDAGSYTEARLFFNTSLELDSSNLQTRLFLARIALVEQNYSEAESGFNSVLNRDPTNIEALSGLLTLGIQNNTEAEKVEQVRQISEQFPNAFTPPLVLSQYFLGIDELENALEFAQIAYSRNENVYTENTLIDTLISQSSAARRDQNLALAEQRISQALEMQNDNVGALTIAAGIAAQNGNFDIAGAHIEKIKEAQPDSAFGFEIEGDLLIAQELLEPALESFQSGWDITISSSLGAKIYGALTALERTEEASQLLAEWVEVMPDNGAVNLRIALENQQNDQNTEAIEHYEIAFRQQPDNLVILNNLAWLYQDSLPTRALELSSRAFELFPDNPDVLDTYGWILFKQGDHSTSIEILQRAQELAPESEAIAEHLNTASQ